MSPPKSLTNAHHVPPGTGVTVTGGMSSPATSLGEKTLLQSIRAATVVSALPDADAFAGPPPEVAAASVRDGEHAIAMNTAQAIALDPIFQRNMTSSWKSVVRSRIEQVCSARRMLADARYPAVSAAVICLSRVTSCRGIPALAAWSGAVGSRHPRRAAAGGR